MKYLLTVAAILAAAPALAADEPVLGSYAGAGAFGALNNQPNLVFPDWDFRTDGSIAQDSAVSNPTLRTDVRAQAAPWANRLEIKSLVDGNAITYGYGFSGSSINQRIEGAPGLAAVEYRFALDGSYAPGPLQNFPPGLRPVGQSFEIVLVAFKGRALGQEYVSGTDAQGFWQDFRLLSTSGTASLFQREGFPNYINTLSDSILGLARICFGPDQECIAPGAIDTTMQIGFDVATGEDFFVSTALLGLTNGTLDFFNTMKLEQVVLAPEFALISEDGGALQRGPGGNYGVPGVPEPSSWAMMIAGFGLAGLAIRRRRGAGVTVRV